jgi:hypothetical protein
MKENFSKPRIVIYGTGTYGKLVARLADKKGWSIVAAFNRAGEKVGQDLGRLAGLDKDFGVVVQDCDTASYDGLDADVAIVATTDILEQNWPAYEKLLGAGLNVICHGGQACYPQASNAKIAEQIESLCHEKNVSFTGSSVWDSSRVWAGLLALGPCIEATSIKHSTLTNVNFPRKDIAEMMSIDSTVEEFEKKVAAATFSLGSIYITIIEQVLAKVGLTVKSKSEKTLPALLEEPVYSFAFERNIEPGRVVGSKIIIDIDTEEGVEVSGNFEVRIITDSEMEYLRWDIEGTPSSSIIVERKDSEVTSAACMLNRVPDIINALPGIQLVADLGPLTPNL